MTQGKPVVRKVLALLALALALNGAANAQGNVPFATSTPTGYAWWCNSGATTCLLLPSEVASGPQGKFFLVTQGNRREALLVAWMGGGESVWQGGLKAANMEWQATLAAGSGRRGLIGASQSGGWTFAAVAPESDWGQAAGTYNAILRGEAR